MQTTSDTWKSLWAAGARLETKAVIGGTEYTEMSNPIITRALVQDGLTIGNAVSATLQLSILTDNAIPRAAAVQIQMRLTDGTTNSEWLPAGTFYIARRRRDPVTGILTLDCYDAMLKANAVLDEVPWTTAEGEAITTQSGEMIMFGAVFPRDPVSLVDDIALLLGVSVDSRTTLQTGSAYTVQAPADGATIHDVLCIIAAQNGGNWIITPENKLRLVPLVSAADAEDAETNVIDVVGINGAIQQRVTETVTGIRYVANDVPILLGDDTGLVIDADVGATVAGDLYNALSGITYQAYNLERAIYDPAAELGDYVRAGADGEVNSVLFSETATLGALAFGNISAPEGGEMSDEYPYISSASAKALTAAKVYTQEAVQAFDSSLDQASVFNRLTDGGTTQGIYLYEGKVYINGSYMQIGTITGASGQNYWILDGNDAKLVVQVGQIGEFTLNNGVLEYIHTGQNNDVQRTTISGNSIELSYSGIIGEVKTAHNANGIYWYSNNAIQAGFNLTPASTPNFQLTFGGYTIFHISAVNDMLVFDRPVSFSNGASGTFTTADNKTVTVTNGIVTSIVSNVSP